MKSAKSVSLLILPLLLTTVGHGQNPSIDKKQDKTPNRIQPTRRAWHRVGPESADDAGTQTAKSGSRTDANTKTS